MQTNERGDIIISTDDNINEQIQELIRTLEDSQLQKITLLFECIGSPLLRQEIISQLETANTLWKCKNVYNTICELKNIHWKQHHEKGKKKLTKLTFPVESYAAIHKDQLEINEKARIKFQSV